MLSELRTYTYWILSGVFGFGVLIIACTSEKADRIPKTSNEYLNQLLRGAPVTTINLDGIPIDTFYFEKKNILGDGDGSTFSSPIQMSGVIGMIKIGDSLYVGDYRQDIIGVMDKNGSWIRKLGRKGKGPGEFQMLRDIASNSQYVYTADIGNSRINIYDHHFNLITSLDVVFTALQAEISVTDSLLFLPAGFTDDRLIQVREAKPPFKKLGSFLPRLIPYGMQPIGYNIYHIHSNKAGLIAVGYMGLPYIFIFDKHLEHIRTLILRSASYEHIDNPPLEPVTGRQGDKYKFVPFFRELFLTDEGSLLLIKHPNLYRIVHERRMYQLKQAWYFIYDDQKQRKNDRRSIMIFNAMMDSDTLYISSRFESYVFRVPLN